MKKPAKKTVNKKKTIFLWVFGMIAVMIFFLIAYLFTSVTSPKIVYIPKGSVFKSITHLQNEGVNVHYVDAFLIRIMGQPQHGWIDVKEETMSRAEYLYRLTTAKAATKEVTLIPGETTAVFLNQIAQQLSLDNSKLEQAYKKHAPWPEGNFVPDTYSIPNGIKEEALILHLLQQSEKKMMRWSQEFNIPYKKINMLQIVTKASVVQKEAASLSDMPFVSSVIDNRIRAGMRLQMDGTLNYGEYSHQKVTAKRIRTDKSPYNTYKNKGLPIYPVCNVSKDAIEAAIHPKQTDYLYFVRGKDGEHIYSSYFSTHRKNIENATK